VKDFNFTKGRKTCFPAGNKSSNVVLRREKNRNLYLVRFGHACSLNRANCWWATKLDCRQKNTTTMDANL